MTDVDTQEVSRRARVAFPVRLRCLSVSDLVWPAPGVGQGMLQGSLRAYRS